MSARMRACTVTSSAVVGSSAMIEARRAADSHGDHRALPFAAGELRTDRSARPAPARPDARVRATATALRLRRPLLLKSRCSLSGSATCAPTRRRGLSAVIGSWKIMAMRSPRNSRSCVFVEADQLSPLKADRAGDLRSFGRQAPSTQAPSSSCRSRTRPPRPGFSPSASENDVRSTTRCDPRRVATSTASSATSSSISSRTFSFGSSASRNPSPSRLRPRTLSAIAIPG